MFLGSINFFNKSTARKSGLQDLINQLKWNNCLSFNVKQDSFEAYVLRHTSFEAEQQDICYFNTEENLVLCVEGEIYNKSDLTNTLCLSTPDIKTPELLYKAYLKWGPSFAEHLNGDFSIVVYLPDQQEAYFYRDHLGIRPLAIGKLEDTIYFASDPIGLSKSLYGNKKISADYVRNLVLWEGFNYTTTPNKNVVYIKPGHYLKVTTDKFEQKKYWNPERIQTNHRLTQEQVISKLTELVNNAVQIRSDNKYTAGAHLSGGLDSGTVAALARKAYAHQSDFYGFSWTPQEQLKNNKIAFDERELVKNIAHKNKIEPIFSSINVNDYTACFSDWRHPSEMLYERKTVQEASKRGVNLLFSGWGGDEFISIGHRGIDADLIRQFNWGSFLKKYPIKKPKRLISNLIYNALFPSLRRSYAKYKAEESVFPYIKNVFGNNVIPKNQRFKYTSRRKVHLQLLEKGHLTARTADWYVHGQRNGIEYRYPLLDKRIVEYMLEVPSRCLVGNNHHRILLRIIGKDLLPEEVLKNTSKDDPLKSKQYYTFVDEVKKQFMDEFNEFKTNPDLAFVDFDLLEKDIPTILRNIEEGKEEDGTAIFYYLKAAHEFTKGYYN